MFPTSPEVWITGAAAATSLGESLDATWQAIVAGRTAGQWVDLHTPHGRCVRVPAAPVHGPLLADLGLAASAARADRMALHVARAAAADAHLDAGHLADAAVLFATSKPPVEEWVAAAEAVRNSACASGPFDLLAPHRPASLIARELGMAGPILSAIAACSTGLHGLVRAVQWLRDGHGGLALVGAAESSLNPLYVGAFRQMGVLTSGADAARACRPFDRDRDGFILGEGAASLVVETAAHARRRGARPLAVVSGYALGADPSGLAEPEPAGEPLARTIRQCLANAGLPPAAVACIKTHGTGTRRNDAAEAEAIRSVFGPAGPPAVSWKGYTGHTLGASGAVESAILMRALAHDTLPPTANLHTPGTDCPLHHPPAPCPISHFGGGHVLCLSAGFGGHLAALLVHRGN